MHDGVYDAMYDRDRDGVTCRGPTRGPGHSAGAELYSHASMQLCELTLPVRLHACMRHRT